jgi:membrane protease YdiL (CAAX protease family)
MDVIIHTSSIPGFPLPGLGIKWSLVLCAVFHTVLFASIFVLMLVLLWTMHPSVALPVMLTLIAAPQIVAWAITIKVGLNWSEMSFREARFLSYFPLKILPTLVLTSLGASILVAQIVLRVPLPEIYKESAVNAIQKVPYISIFTPFVVIAPVAEEYFFRGLLLRDFLERYSVTKSVWATAMMFSLFHLNPWQAIAALPLGLWFAWLVLRTGSIIPGMICHAIYNFSAVFLLKPISRALGGSAAEWENSQLLTQTVFAIGLAATFIGSTLLIWQLWGRNPVRIVPVGLPADATASEPVDSSSLLVVENDASNSEGSIAGR